ncbi:hypothetical protein BGZ76_006146, partial [Entomortierella beljakovae]
MSSGTISRYASLFNPIPIDENEEMAKHWWEKDLTGHGLLSIKFPETDLKIDASSVAVVETLCMSEGVLSMDNISNLEKVPNLKLIQHCLKLLVQFEDKSPDKSWCVNIQEFGLASRPWLKSIQTIQQLKDLAKEIKEMLEWLKSNSSDNTLSFIQELSKDLKESEGITRFTFASSRYKSEINLKSALRFREEEWLDTYAVNSVLAIFRSIYSKNMNLVFVPTDHFQDEGSMVWNQHVIKKMAGGLIGTEYNKDHDARAFSIYNTGSHWAALCIDFVKKEVQFGHSMDG